MILERITCARGAPQNADVNRNPYSHGHPRDIIRRLRDLRGFASDRALALAAGIPQPTLSRYLSGVSQDMELSNFAAVAGALDVTVSELLGEVPLGLNLKAREIVRILERLPEPEQAALVAAGAAMAAALGKPS